MEDHAIGRSRGPEWRGIERLLREAEGNSNIQRCWSPCSSPATTVALLKLNAVVGVKAEVDATLLDVVQHYDRVLALGLTEQQRDDLVEFLKTL